jgi:DNA-binding protein HU-beta
MNKTELINALSEETVTNKKEVTRILDGLLRIIARGIKKGQRVQISGFGTFTITRRPARKGINPATKEPIALPEVFVPKFKPGKHLKEMVRALKFA